MTNTKCQCQNQHKVDSSIFQKFEVNKSEKTANLDDEFPLRIDSSNFFKRLYTSAIDSIFTIQRGKAYGIQTYQVIQALWYKESIRNMFSAAYIHITL